MGATKHTTLNITKTKNFHITAVTEVSKITGPMSCITTLKPVPVALETPQCKTFLGTLTFIPTAMECPMFIKLKFMLQWKLLFWDFT
jgi:hypothetical protein